MGAESRLVIYDYKNKKLVGKEANEFFCNLFGRQSLLAILARRYSILVLEALIEIGGIGETNLFANLAYGVFAFQQELGGNAQTLVLDIDVWRNTHDALRAVIYRGTAQAEQLGKAVYIEVVVADMLCHDCLQLVLELLVQG